MSLTRQQRRAAERQARKNFRKGAAEMLPDPTPASATVTALESAAVAPEPAVSQARLQANRVNAQASTGPKTDAGKAVSSQNSFRHGIYSKQLVIQGEDPAALDALKADLMAEHNPATLTEGILVNEMAEHYWRMLRFRRFETTLMHDLKFVIAQLTAVQRFLNSAERGFHKALKILREVQKERRAGDHSARGATTGSSAVPVGGGFVPHKAENTKEAVRTTAANGFVPAQSAAASALPDRLQSLDAKCAAVEAFLRAA